MRTQAAGKMELQYEGEWVQGRKEGLGTQYFNNSESYAGQFVADIRHGFGRFFFSNGDVYGALTADCCARCVSLAAACWPRLEAWFQDSRD